MDKELGLMAILQGIPIKRASRHAESDHSLYTIIDNSDPQSYPGAKREACDECRDARITPTEKLQYITYIVHLSTPFIIGARAVSDTAEIEAQCWNTERLKRFCRLKNDFIMHRATIKWMWVADESNEICL